MGLLFRPVLFAAVCLGLATDISSGLAAEPKVKLELRRAELKAAEGLIEATVLGQKEKIYLHKTAELTEADIAEARIGVDNQTFGPIIDIAFTKEGSKKFEKLTESHIEKPIAVVVDGKVISAPIVKSKISDRAQITGSFTKEEVEKIVKALNRK